MQQEQEIDLDEFLRSGAVMSITPQNLLIQWGNRTWHAHVIDNEQPKLYFPDFFLRDSSPWCSHRFSCIMPAAGLLQLLGKNSSTPVLEWQKPSLSAFTAAFNCVQDTLKGKSIKKCVPYIFENSVEAFTVSHLRQSLSLLLQGLPHTSSYLYGCWGEHEGILGLTPELLFHYRPEEGLLKTMALAGTRPSGEEELLERDEKMGEEHRWVVEGIKEKMSALGVCSTSKRGILRLPHLSHLATYLSVCLSRPEPIEKIIDRLHPTPALGGYPKEAVWPLLQELDSKMPRARFGAPVGVAYGKEAICYVGIRNIQWDAFTARIGAGCGVIKESILEKEWEEIQWKLRAIKKMLFSRP